tara:strand:- start:7726 stop:9735 length:2010 start_codon:yes stop_codon:yes gene_type:complete
MSKIKNLSEASIQVRNFSNLEIKGKILGILIEKYGIAEADVDPEHLKMLSQIVDRELEAKKDTEDYNMDLVSNIVDSSIDALMQAGLDTIKNGDVINLDKKLKNNFLNEDSIKDLEEASKNGSYRQFPFNRFLEKEIRAKYLLKTEKDDTFEKLMEELDEHMPKFFMINELEGSWDDLKKIIYRAENRIKNNFYYFIGPRKLLGEDASEEELNKYDIPQDLREYVEKRNDDHDLLAMKDMVNIAKGGEVNSLSIGFGFFNKYMMEMEQVGFTGLVFKVVKNRLHSVMLSRVIDDWNIYNMGEKHLHHEHMDEENRYPYMFLPYTPAKAIINAMNFHRVENIKGIISFRDHMVDKEVDFHYLEKDNKKLTIKNVLNPFYDKGAKFFIVMDGGVGAPIQNKIYEYEDFAFNDGVVRAGETYLFEWENEDLLMTRLYFSPYDYKELHVLHQHGSVVFGANDQSLQSCVYEDLFNNYFADNGRLHLIGTWKDRNGHLDQALNDSITMARLHKFPKFQKSMILFEEFKKELRKVVSGQYGTNKAEVITWCFDYLTNVKKDGFLIECGRSGLYWSQYYAPLSRRWLLKKYLDGSSGITKKMQEDTHYRNLAIKNEFDNVLKSSEYDRKFNQIERLMKKKGVSFEEAQKELFGKDITESDEDMKRTIDFLKNRKKK